MNATSQIKNTVKICADSKRFDSPTDSETGAAVKFRQFDAVQFGVVFRTNGALADLSNAAYAELEISDIGALNRPEPRTASVLVRKRVSALETSLDESAVGAGTCHATFELEKSDTKIDAGEKWLRIFAVDSDGSRTSFANGWIFVEPTYGDDSNLATPDDLKYIVSARDYAEVSEGYANGGSAELAETSPYYKNNAKYFFEQAKAHSKLSSDYATQAQTSFFGASASEESANGYAASATRSASAAASSASSASASASSAASAKTAAQQAAASAAASDAGRLALCKSDNGILYFTGGAATATPNLAFDTLSVLFKTDFDFSVVQTADLHVFFPFYIGTTGKGEFFSCQYGMGNKLRVHRAVANAAAYVGNFDRANIAPLVGNGLNALAFVFKKLADGNTQLSLYVNGVLVPNNATAAVAYPTLDSFISINKWGSTTASAGTVGYSDFRIFNFDVSAEDAPYSLADYQAGKRLPPSLTGVQLVLENYTFDDKIRDISGNEQHATISGSVAGDMDNSINQMYSAFSAKYTQENAS